MDFVLEYLPWFCFENGRAHGGAEPAGYAGSFQWQALAFATVAALAFLGFVLIGLIRDFDAVHGAHPVRGAAARAVNGRLVAATLLGTLAAFLVALVVVLLDVVQVNAQTGVVVGVTWQITYAKLLTEMKRKAEDAPAVPDQAAPPTQKRAVEQEDSQEG